MVFAIPDLIGTAGVIIVLTTYLLVQIGRMETRSILYQLLNMLACMLIGISLYYAFNLPSAIVQSFWFLISLFGLLRNLVAAPGRKTEGSD